MNLVLISLVAGCHTVAAGLVDAAVGGAGAAGCGMTVAGVVTGVDGLRVLLVVVSVLGVDLA